MNASSGTSRRVASVPNLISGLRLATVPPFVWLFVTGRENPAVLLYGVAAATDFFDGYIARRTGAVTELGKLLDPLADRVFIIALAMALVARGTLPLWLAGVVIARDVLVVSLWPVLERRRVARIPVSNLGKTATALLLVGLVALATSETTFTPAEASRAIGLVSTFAGAIAYWAAAVGYAQEARARLGWRGTAP
jgi:cardiolipin synthase (CMP-forming)